MPDKGTQVKMEEIDCGASQPITVLRFIGDITSLSQAAVLGTYQGLPDTTKKILIDFSKVEYLNSSGIALVIQMMIAASKKGPDHSDLRPHTALPESVHHGRHHPLHQAPSRRADRLRRLRRVIWVPRARSMDL